MNLNPSPARRCSTQHDFRHSDAMRNAIRVIPGSTGITILYRDGTAAFISNNVDNQRTGSALAGWHS